MRGLGHSVNRRTLNVWGKLKSCCPHTKFPKVSSYERQQKQQGKKDRGARVSGLLDRKWLRKIGIRERPWISPWSLETATTLWSSSEYLALKEEFCRTTGWCTFSYLFSTGRHENLGEKPVKLSRSSLKNVARRAG